MGNKRVILWDVKVSPHKDKGYQWARILPSFEKGWVTITPHALKAKVAKNATVAEIREAVVKRLEKAGQPFTVPIQIVSQEEA